MIPAALFDLSEVEALDVAVVGAGGAGMAVALILGLKPLLVENTDGLGGTSVYSSGGARIPNTRHVAAVGTDDGFEKAEPYLRNSIENESPESMRTAYRHPVRFG